MNAKTLLAAAFVSMALTLRAQQAADNTLTSRRPLDWNDPKWWEVMKPKSPGLALGKSDFTAHGPLVDTFRIAPHSSEDKSLGRKILDLPIINLFVPGPMPRPTGQGKYFAWGERETAWTVLADRPIPGPQNSLLSVSR